MLLAIDIGNTNITLGIFDGKILRSTWRFATGSQKTQDEYLLDFKALFEELKVEVAIIKDIIIVSVVPKTLTLIESALKRIFNKDIILVGRDLDAGVKNLYDDPKQVGQDRLVNAKAAYSIYGGPAIIVDFGTAITCDVVSKIGEYLGGVIAPGVEISLKALVERAALLPEIELEEPKGILGKDTKESMRSGIFYGFSSLCDGIVRSLKEVSFRDATVIATGGHSKLIGPYCETVEKIDLDLTLKGLEIIYRERCLK